MKNSDFFVVLALAMLAALSGCGSSQPKSSAANVESASQEIDEIKPATKAPGGHSPAGATLTGQQFDTEVMQGKGLILIDFWATWCIPCKQLAPTLVELSKDFDGKIKFANVDIDKDEALAKKFNIDSIPCLILFKDGKELDRKVGLQQKEELKSWLDSATSK